MDGLREVSVEALFLLISSFSDAVDSEFSYFFYPNNSFSIFDDSVILNYCYLDNSYNNDFSIFASYFT